MYNVNNKQMVVLCGSESESLSEGAYDAICAISLFGFESAHFSRERFSGVAVF